MKHNSIARVLLLNFICLVILIPTLSHAQENTVREGKDIWVSAYLASYNHFAPPTGNWGNLPAGQIDWDAFTHLFYFSFNVKPDGSLSKVAPYENLNPDRIQSIVKAAHQADTPVLFTVGGWGNYDGFSEAIMPENRSNFIDNLIQTLNNWGFDGIDLDMEPIKDKDLAHYKNFIKALHQKLQNTQTHRGKRPLLTIATDSQPQFFAEVHEMFDQINLMTYDYSGAWQGWVSWHNSPIYSSHNFPNNDKPLPSIDESVQKFVSAGVPSSKLGIGIDFYGYVWQGGSGTSSGGVTKPNQSWDTTPTVTDNVPYHKIMGQHYSKEAYHWDEEAKAAYLSIDHPGSKNDMFISFDDERAIRNKFNYIKENNLGGAIIWELAGGYRQNMPAGQRDLLLQQIENIIRN